MGRNNERNKNITVPFAREGRTLASLVADATRNNMMRLIGVLVGLRLGEYYEAVEEGRILPKGLTYNGVSVVPVQQGPASFTQSLNGQQPGVADAPVLPAPVISAADLQRLQDRPDIIQSSGEISDDDLDYFLQEDNEE